MPTDATTLADMVRAMRPMVPAKDCEISGRFYVDLGFRPQTLTERLIEMHLGSYSFILQGYYTSGAVIALAMTLNELCTNATKFGALSAAAGRIDITWTIDEETRALRLSSGRLPGEVLAPV
jgi:hypothetical protein